MSAFLACGSEPVDQLAREEQRVVHLILRAITTSLEMGGSVHIRFFSALKKWAGRDVRFRYLNLVSFLETEHNARPILVGSTSVLPKKVCWANESSGVADIRIGQIAERSGE